MNKRKPSSFKGRKHKCPACDCNRAVEIKEFEREVIKPMEQAFEKKPFVFKFADSAFNNFKK